MTDQETPITEVEEDSGVTDWSSHQTVISPTWPRDEYGITSALRRELARCAGRINGDEKKLELFIATVVTGAEWAKGRMAVQRGIKEGRARDVAARIAVDQAAVDKENKDAPEQETAEQRVVRQRNAGIGGATENKG